MPTDPLFPEKPEHATNAQPSGEVVRMVVPGEVEQHLHESIEKYGPDKPRRTRITATIIHD